MKHTVNIMGDNCPNDFLIAVTVPGWGNSTSECGIHASPFLYNYILNYLISNYIIQELCS